MNTRQLGHSAAWPPPHLAWDPWGPHAEVNWRCAHACSYTRNTRICITATCRARSWNLAKTVKRRDAWQKYNILLGRWNLQQPPHFSSLFNAGCTPLPGLSAPKPRGTTYTLGEAGTRTMDQNEG